MSRSRTTLALCLVAVAASATLFPAAGLGSHPGGSLPADARPHTATAAPSSGTAAPSQSATTTPTPTATPVDGSPTATPTPEPTATPTEAPTPTEAIVGDSGGGNYPLLTAVFLLALAVLAVLRVRRRVRTVDRAITAFGGWFPDLPVPSLARLPRATMTALVGGSTRAGALLTGAGRTVSGVLGGVGSAVGSLTIPSLRLPSRSGRGADAAAAVGSALRRDDGEAGAQPTAAAPDEPSERRPPESVREAWAALRREVSPPRPDARTPGEVARAAVAAGYPADAVRRLTRAFREVRYGGRDDEGRLDTVREALSRIRGGER